MNLMELLNEKFNAPQGYGRGVDMARGAAAATLPSYLGGPVDLLTMIANAALPKQYEIKDPVLGSEHVARMMGLGKPQDSGAYDKGYMASALMQMLAPVAATTIGSRAARMGGNEKGQTSVMAQKETSGRRIKAGDRAGRYTGAPPGVNSPQAFSAVVDRYKKDAELGVMGREWYRDIGQEIGKYSPDTNTARNFAENFAATAPQATVPSNLTFAIKGHNQAVLGAPVSTGRYPQAMSPQIEAIYRGEEGGISGLKRSPFAMNMAVGGGFGPPGVTRPVHDMWTAASVGYPKGTIPGEAGHAFMDKVVRNAEDRLNKAQFGGFSNWDDLNTQAANWVGARIRAGEMTPEDAARMPSTLFGPRSARITQEMTPGSNTGHLQGLLSAPSQVREQYFDDLSRALVDPATGQSRVAQKLGAMSPPAIRQRGVFEGDINPGQITEVLAAPPTGAKPGAMELGAADQKIVDAVMRTHDLLTQQKAGASHKIVADAGPKSANFAYLKAGTTDDELRALDKMIAEKFGGNAFIVSTDGGRVGILNGGAQDFGKGMQDLAKQLKADATFHKAHSSYVEYPWGQAPGAVSKDFLRFVEDPAFPGLAGRVDDAVRSMAGDVGAAQAGYSAYQANPLVTNLLKILQEGGLKGLRDAAERGLVPAVVGAPLGGSLLNWSPDQQ